MTTLPGRDLVLELERIEELFDAPDADPFSERELDILGEAGIDRVAKRLNAVWPWRRTFDRVVLTLPADKVTPDIAAQVRLALRRHCDARLEQNRYLRKGTMRVGKRQLVIALIILALDVLVLYWISTIAAQGLPGFLAGIVVILALFAGSLAIWDAIEALAFNWVPFVMDDACYRSIRELDVAVVPRRETGASQAAEARTRGLS